MTYGYNIKYIKKYRLFLFFFIIMGIIAREMFSMTVGVRKIVSVRITGAAHAVTYETIVSVRVTWLQQLDWSRTLIIYLPVTRLSTNHYETRGLWDTEVEGQRAICCRVSKCWSINYRERLVYKLPKRSSRVEYALWCIALAFLMEKLQSALIALPAGSLSISLFAILSWTFEYHYCDDYPGTIVGILRSSPIISLQPLCSL